MDKYDRQAQSTSGLLSGGNSGWWTLNKYGAVIEHETETRDLAIQALALHQELLSSALRNLRPGVPVDAAGRRGGSARSPRKAEAARANGRKGGRPRREPKEEP
jgi:hypothetical protein